MTEDQADSWEANPNAYVADEEEETFTARVSGELLLDELCNVGLITVWSIYRVYIESSLTMYELV